MSIICSTCGLPKELCVCEAISKETQKITVSIEEKKFGKRYTVIKGFSKEINIKEIAKKLKEQFACGGTVKDSTIELQGDHRPKAKAALAGLGFSQNQVEVR